MQTKPITAISTPPGRGGIGIIRISGNDILPIILPFFQFRDPNTSPIHGVMNFGNFIENNVPIDSGYLVYFKSPQSFTGEDVVELHLHGSPVLLQTILNTLIHQTPISLAKPGEFSKRAFLNGKIDLTQAEAIMDVIDAKTPKSARLASLQLHGNITQFIIDFRKQLLFELAHLEAWLDFPEDQIPDIDFEHFFQVVENQSKKLNELIEKSQNAWVYREGIKVAIIGEPNMGKSSIFNALLSKNRAIISDIKGTTRDVIEESFQVDGIVISLLDTAGIRLSKDEIESLGIERTLKTLVEANILIIVLDASSNESTEDSLFESFPQEIKDLQKTKKTLIIQNKYDLYTSKNIPKNHLTVSAKTGVGIQELKQVIKNEFLTRPPDTDLLVTNIRQFEHLKSALTHLKSINDSKSNTPYFDAIAIDLRDALEELSSVLGESLQSDMYHQIFSRFCIGK